MAKFLIKPCVAMVGAVLLGACQSTPTATHSHVHIFATAESVFDSPSTSAHAKTHLLQAMTHHLSQERYGVTTQHYQLTPIDQKDSLDVYADNAWHSFLKVYEYIQENRYRTVKQGFRGHDEYFHNDNDELPYLRYDDEMAEYETDTVARSVAVSYDYQAIDDEIEGMYYQAKECVIPASYQLDELVRNNPKIDNKRADVKEVLTELSDCQTQLQQNSEKILPIAQGYQIQKINDIQQCFGSYKAGIDEILQSSRRPKNLDYHNYDGYDAVYENYDACNRLISINMELEPSEYIEQELDQEKLDRHLKIKACYVSGLDAQNALRQQGKSYRLHADEFAQSYYEQMTCVGKAAGQWMDTIELTEDGELAKPIESMSDAKDVRLAYDYGNDYGDDEYEMYGRYRGVQGWLNAIREMNLAKENHQNDNTDEQSESRQEMEELGVNGVYANMMGKVLDHLKRTPEQIQAQNLYQYNNTKLTQLVHHNPQQKYWQMLMSFDFESPTAKQSVQLPMQMDFKTGVFKADVSAALPLVAFVAPKHTPLPKDIPNGQMTFQLNDELAKKLPSHVIYEAIIQGIKSGFATMEDESLTLVDGRYDGFAQQVQAQSVIKLDFDSKRQGKFYATIAKQVAHDLKAYVDANPELYPDTDNETKDVSHTTDTQPTQTADNIKQLIDDFVAINQMYHTSDVGGLWQAIEGILPLSFDKSVYFYLDKQNSLIAMQTISTVSDLSQSVRFKSIAQTRYDKRLFDLHELSSSFYRSANESATFDGGKWLSVIKDEYEFKKNAQEARRDYIFEELLSQLDTDSEEMSSEAADETQVDGDEFIQ